MFVNDGSLSNAGSVTLSGDASWTQNAHNTAQSGNPVTILNSGTLTDMTGAGSFTLTDTPILTGTIPAGQTVAVSAPSGHGATVSLNGGTVINDGNLNMDAPAGGETPIIDDGSITNNGAITTTSESSNPNQLQANLTNNATVEVKTGTLQQSAATTTTNASGGTLTVDTGASFTPDNASAKVINNATAPAGVVNHGTTSLSSDASWTQNGPESGNPVTILNSGTLTDTSGTGSFTLTDSPILTGTIPAGQTVTISAPSGHGATVSLNNGTLTNDGTLNMDAPAGGETPAIGAGTITNAGKITTTSESGNDNELLATLNNGGTLEVKTGTLLQNTGTTTTNSGTLLVDPGAAYSPANANAKLVNAASGTLEFEIASGTSYGTIALAGGATVQPGGTVDPVLLTGFNPPVGTEFDVITGGDPGAFPTVANNFTGDSSHLSFFGVIRGQDSTTTALASSANPSAFGASVTLTATVTAAPGGVTGTNPTGTVTFSDGTTTLGTQSVSTSGGITTAKLTTAALVSGTHSLTATYNGDSNYHVSLSAALNETVTKASASAAVTLSAPRLAVGQSETITATVTGVAGAAAPTGQVTFTADGSTLGTGTVTTSNGITRATFTTSALTVGTHSLTAVYAGDADYAGATAAPATASVSPDGTTTTLTPNANPAPDGAPVLLTATVAPVPGGLAPTGTVAFTVDGSRAGSGTLTTSNGITTATFSVTGLTPGTHALAASYAGDANHTTSSSGTVSETIAKPVASVAVALSNPTIAAGQSETITATVTVPAGAATPTGTVTFTDGSTPLQTVPLSGTGTTATASFTTSALAVGSHTLGATYSGDVNYPTAAATGTPATTVTVQPGPPTTTTSATSTATASATSSTTGSGSVSAASTTVTASSSTTAHVPPPPPVLFKSVNVVPVSGTVFIKLPPGATLSRARPAPRRSRARRRARASSR